MKSNLVKIHPEKDLLKKEEQLAWKMAQLKHRAELSCWEWLSRIIDNAAVKSQVITANGPCIYGY